MADEKVSRSNTAVLQDKGLQQLQDASGSESTISRNRNLAVFGIVVGVVGAIGVGLRPVLEKRFAANAARQAAIAQASKQQRVVTDSDQARLARMIHRLHYLQARHLVRHPMWYAMTPQDPRVQAAAASLQRLEAAAASSSNSSSNSNSSSSSSGLAGSETLR